jgi:hypothetical protein
MTLEPGLYVPTQRVAIAASRSATGTLGAVSISVLGATRGLTAGHVAAREGVMIHFVRLAGTESGDQDGLVEPLGRVLHHTGLPDIAVFEIDPNMVSRLGHLRRVVLSRRPVASGAELTCWGAASGKLASQVVRIDESELHAVLSPIGRATDFGDSGAGWVSPDFQLEGIHRGVDPSNEGKRRMTVARVLTRNQLLKDQGSLLA